MRIGGADQAALRARKFFLINIHEEGVFHTLTRTKMAVRLVFAAPEVAASVRDAGHKQNIRDCPGRFGTVGTYVSNGGTIQNPEMVSACLSF